MKPDMTLMFVQFVPSAEEEERLTRELQATLEDQGIHVTIESSSVGMAGSEGGRFLHEIAVYVNTPVGTAILGAVTGKVFELLCRWSFSSLSAMKRSGGYLDKELDRRVVIYGPDHTVMKAAVVHSDGTVTEYKTAAGTLAKRHKGGLGTAFVRLRHAASMLFKKRKKYS